MVLCFCFLCVPEKIIKIVEHLDCFFFSFLWCTIFQFKWNFKRDIQHKDHVIGCSVALMCGKVTHHAVGGGWSFLTSIRGGTPAANHSSCWAPNGMCSKKYSLNGNNEINQLLFDWHSHLRNKFGCSHTGLTVVFVMTLSHLFFCGN